MVIVVKAVNECLNEGQENGLKTNGATNRQERVLRKEGWVEERRDTMEGGRRRAAQLNTVNCVLPVGDTHPPQTIGRPVPESLNLNPWTSIPGKSLSRKASQSPP